MNNSYVLLMFLDKHGITVPSEIQWTSFYLFKMSLMISFRTEILHMHIICTIVCLNI